VIPATPLTVLIVKELESDALLIESELRRAGFDPAWTRVDTEDDYLAGLAAEPALILADYKLPQFDALRALQMLRERDLDIPFIIVSGSIGEDLAVMVLQGGASDYLLKERLGRLGQAVTNALVQQKLRNAKRLADQALQEKLRLAALTADIGLAQTASHSLGDILQRYAESLVRHLEVALACIWTPDDSGKILELQASAGVSTAGMESFRRVVVGQFCVGLVAEHQLLHLTNDVANESCFADREWARREGLSAFAGYPLLVEDQLVGVTAIFGRKTLSQATLDAMSAVANHIALGIEHKRTEESLLLTERRLQQLVSTTPAVIYALRIEGATCIPTWVSQSIVRLTGYDEMEALQPRWWHDHVHPEDLERAHDFMAALLGHLNFAAEYRFRCLNGEYRWLLDQKRLIRDEHGKPAEIVGSWLDITERKRMEEQFRQAHKIEAIGRLAGGIAHDFNNLLTVIMGYSELILETFDRDDPLREFVEEINRAGARGASLTRQLLAFSRRQLLVPVVLDFNALLAETEKMLRRLIGEDIDLVVRSTPTLWQVKVDPGQMEQVVMNLVVNARDAMPRGGKLTIKTDNVVLDDAYVWTHPQARKGKHIRICVSDTGAGMNADTLSRIFEPFFTTKGNDGGTGLGLATVYGIVAQSGGHIEVSSELGLGTTFKIYIPRNVGGTTHGGLPLQASTARGTETVLLVEDSEGVRSLARLALERRGYVVLEAGHPHDALRLLENLTDPVHIMVTDVVMPEMSGRELAERLAPTWPGMKVLYISGYTDDAVVRHGILEQGTPFLQKPFTPDALAQKVRKVLDQDA
jgi:PAS domain S-box-containing protein